MRRLFLGNDTKNSSRGEWSSEDLELLLLLPVGGFACDNKCPFVGEGGKIFIPHRGHRSFQVDSSIVSCSK